MPAPFGGRFKILSEEYPHLLLRLLGVLKPGMKTEFIDILRELADRLLLEIDQIASPELLGNLFTVAIKAPTSGEIRAAIQAVLRLFLIPHLFQQRTQFRKTDSLAVPVAILQSVDRRPC